MGPAAHAQPYAEGALERGQRSRHRRRRRVQQGGRIRQRARVGDREEVLELSERDVAGHVAPGFGPNAEPIAARSEEHTSELQSLMRLSYAGLVLKKNKT